MNTGLFFCPNRHLPPVLRSCFCFRVLKISTLSRDFSTNSSNCKRSPLLSGNGVSRFAFLFQTQSRTSLRRLNFSNFQLKFSNFTGCLSFLTWCHECLGSLSRDITTGTKTPLYQDSQGLPRSHLCNTEWEGSNFSQILFSTWFYILLFL